MSVDVQDLDVEDEGLQCPPSPLLFDTALALEDQTIREIAEAPMDILTGVDHGDLDGSSQDAELSERDEVSVEDLVIITVACWINLTMQTKQYICSLQWHLSTRSTVLFFRLNLKCLKQLDKQFPCRIHQETLTRKQQMPSPEHLVTWFSQLSFCWYF